MRGLGQYVGDIRLPDMQDVAFVRSPLAHARIRGHRHSRSLSGTGSSSAADLDGVKADPGRVGIARLQGLRAAAARDRQGRGMSAS